MNLQFSNLRKKDLIYWTSLIFYFNKVKLVQHACNIQAHLWALRFKIELCQSLTILLCLHFICYYPVPPYPATGNTPQLQHTTRHRTRPGGRELWLWLGMIFGEWSLLPYFHAKWRATAMLWRGCGGSLEITTQSVTSSHHGDQNCSPWSRLMSLSCNVSDDSEVCGLWIKIDFPTTGFALAGMERSWKGKVTPTWD